MGRYALQSWVFAPWASRPWAIAGQEGEAAPLTGPLGFIIERRSRLFTVIERGDMHCGHEVLEHYSTEDKTYLIDLGRVVEGRTITSLTSVTSDDDAMTVGSTSVLDADVTEYDSWGNEVTVEADTAVYVTLDGGTAGVDSDIETARLTITFVTSAGTEVAQVPVKVL